MAFLESFLQAIIFIFTYPLVGSWIEQAGLEATGNNYKDKSFNILALVLYGAIVGAVIWLSQEISNSLFILIPASLLIITGAALRLKYEDDYELSWFVKSFSIKIALALFIAFMMGNNK